MRHRRWKDVQIVVTDFETTGKTPMKICEWATVPIHQGIVRADLAYVEQINPQSEFNRHACMLHGLGPRNLSRCQVISDFYGEFEMVFGPLVVAHSASTEATCMKTEMPGFKLPIILDTRTWAKKLFPKEKHALDPLIARYNIHPRIKRHPQGREVRRHRAYYDAVAAAHIFVEFARSMRNSDTATIGDIAAICEYRPK